MKIAVIGGTGQVGSRIVTEALNRGHQVHVILRHPEKLSVDVPYLQKDLFQLTTEDLKDFDVVVDAFNAPKGHEEMHQTSLAYLTKILTGTGVRLLVVGGASSLFVDPAKTKRLIDTFSEDAAIYPTAKNMAQALTELKKATGLVWTYLSPAAYFQPNGERTGDYQLNDERLIKNHAGKSEISMADYAIAMVDEIENAAHPNEHISVVSQ